MKRELKLNFGQLRQVEEKVKGFLEALEDIEGAAAYFDDVLGEQESDAVEVLRERYREMEEDISYFKDILGQLDDLLEGYINDMESCIMPKDEGRMMLVDRNDIWWNMKQIKANLAQADDIASGWELGYYSDIDTTPAPPHIHEEMSPGERDAAWSRYHAALQESKNRKANYNALKGFCDGTAKRVLDRLEEIYGDMEKLYQEQVVEFENTDDAYKRKAEDVYDACTSAGEWYWDYLERKIDFFLDIHKGTVNAAIDFVSGILGLAFMLEKIDVALKVAVVTVPLGITPQWVKDTGKEVMEGAGSIVEILKNPGRALAAIGQKATDAVEEKGITYVVSYTVADIAIGKLVDMGVGKLRALAKGDDLAGVAKALDQIDDAMDMTNVADDLGNVAKAVEGGDGIPNAVEIANELGGVENAVEVIDKLENAGEIMDKLDSMVDGVTGAGGTDTSFTWKLRGENVTLNDVKVQEISYVKRSSTELKTLRDEFNTSTRKAFLEDLGKNAEYLKNAGFSENDILKIQNGRIPDGWQVHHKLPLDDSGTNSFDNLVFIQNEPYHKVITNYQNSVARQMEIGEVQAVQWPMPNGNIYPTQH